MGLKQFLWQHTPTGKLINNVKNDIEEKGLVRTAAENIECIKNSNPVTKSAYDNVKNVIEESKLSDALAKTATKSAEYIKNNSPITKSAYDNVTNAIEESKLSDALVKTATKNVEYIKNNNPITKDAYERGKCEGRKEGYEVASNVYQKKMLEQADMFLKQKEIFERQRNAYEQLLDEYEKEIDALKNKNNKTEKEDAFLQELLIREKDLTQLHKEPLKLNK